MRRHNPRGLWRRSCHGLVREMQCPCLCRQQSAWKAQHRLHAPYRKLTAWGRDKGEVIAAIGHELLGFIWAISVKGEAAQKRTEVSCFLRQGAVTRQRG